MWMENENRIEAVKHILATVFSAQNALRSLASEYKWAGLGNLLGDYGEFVAVNAYNLEKAAGGSNGFDALTQDGRTVQIKANHAASQIGFRGAADLMLVLHVDVNGDWEEVYFGDFDVVKNECRYAARDNKHMIAISKLRKLTAFQATHPSSLF
jgi:hypothetical protein